MTTKTIANLVQSLGLHEAIALVELSNYYLTKTTEMPDDTKTYRTLVEAMESMSLDELVKLRQLIQQKLFVHEVAYLHGRKHLPPRMLRLPFPEMGPKRRRPERPPAPVQRTHDPERPRHQPGGTGSSGSAPQDSRPLTKAERREYDKLFAAWTTDGGRGAELLSPEQISRFSQLSERINNSISRETSA